ncbi:hypothetical protein D3C78_1275900 [compost metagenome]
MSEQFRFAARVETIADHAAIDPDRGDIEIIGDLARVAHQFAAHRGELTSLARHLGQRFAVLLAVQHQGLVTAIAGDDDPIGKHLPDLGLGTVDVIADAIGVLQAVVGDDGDGFGGVRARQHPVELGVELGLGGIRRDSRGHIGRLGLLRRLAKQGEPADIAEIEAGGFASLTGHDRWLPGGITRRLGQIEQTPGEAGTLMGQQQQQQPEQRLAETGEWHAVATSQKGTE